MKADNTSIESLMARTSLAELQNDRALSHLAQLIDALSIARYEIGFRQAQRLASELQSHPYCGEPLNTCLPRFG